VRVDDDLGLAAGSRGFFRKFEQGVAMALPLDIGPDADQTQGCRALANEIDPHCAQDFAVAQRQVRKMAEREPVRVVFVINLVRQRPAGSRDKRPILATNARAADDSAEGVRPFALSVTSLAIASLGHGA